MRRSYLIVLIFSLMGVIDSGGHARLTIKQAFTRMGDRTLIDWLRSEFPDLGRHIDDADQNRQIAETLVRYGNATDASKYGIENSGVCLLVSLLVQMLESEDFNGIGV